MKMCAKVICFVLGMMLSTVVNGKDFGMSVGLRDTQYAYVGAMWRQTAGLAVEHSIFSEPFSLQYVRIYGRFRRNVGHLGLELSPYYGRAYNGAFYSVGGMFGARWHIVRRFEAYGCLNPVYDSRLGYKTTFCLGGYVKVIESLDVTVEYSTIPRYRQSERLVNGGFRFRAGGLSVTPRLSFPIKERAKSVRVLVSFDYSFSL